MIMPNVNTNLGSTDCQNLITQICDKWGVGFAVKHLCRTHGVETVAPFVAACAREEVRLYDREQQGLVVIGAFMAALPDVLGKPRKGNT